MIICEQLEGERVVQRWEFEEDTSPEDLAAGVRTADLYLDGSFLEGDALVLRWRVGER